MSFTEGYEASRWQRRDWDTESLTQSLQSPLSHVTLFPFLCRKHYEL